MNIDIRKLILNYPLLSSGLMNKDSSCRWKYVDSDQLASLEASWYESTLF